MKIQHGKNNSTSAGKSAPINDSLRSEMYSEGIFLIGDGKVIKKKKHVMFPGVLRKVVWDKNLERTLLR